MRRAVESTFPADAGTELFYRHWPAEALSGRAVILLHRGHEHSGRWQGAVDALDLPDVQFFAWDARGHGRSPGERGRAASFGQWVRDCDAFAAHVARRHGISPRDTAVMAHSVGSVIAAAWAHDHAPEIRALVLGSPALEVRLYVPLAIPALRALLKLRPGLTVKSYVKARLLTHDPDEQAAYEADPLISPTIAAHMLVGLRDAGARLVADAAAITTPALVLTSGADWVVSQEAQRRFFEGLAGAPKRQVVLPGFFHATFHEKDRAVPIAEARAFLTAAFESAAAPAPLLDADERGPTADEYRRLSKPLPGWHPKRWGYAAQRLTLKTVGRLSEGIRLGWKTGFDSGAMLDYVYDDRARGVGPLGRLIDRIYLDSPGWTGIRERRRNLSAMLREAAGALRAEGHAVSLVDLAAGHGRYVLDAVGAAPDLFDDVLLRDFDAANVAAGSRRIVELGLRSARFERGDAFSPGDLASLPERTLAVVSGLYELFPANAPVRTSLSGLASRLSPGGFLVYTNQPWHPQLELIARVLTSHRGGAWVMRRRTQREMDDLVRAAGLVKLRTVADDGGIFTVSLARKPA